MIVDPVGPVGDIQSRSLSIIVGVRFKFVPPLLLLLPTSTTREITLAGGGGMVLILLLVSPVDRLLTVRTGTSEPRFGGARFNCEAAVFSKFAVLMTNLSPALLNMELEVTIEGLAVTTLLWVVMGNGELALSKVLF